MAKLRVKTRYGIVPNKLLNDPNISLKAKGLFGYLQSKPDEWDFSGHRMKLDHSDGRDSVYAGLKELEDNGYLTRRKIKDNKGLWDYEYELSETPYTDKPSTDNPYTDNPYNNKERNSKGEKEKKINNNNTLGEQSPPTESLDQEEVYKDTRFIFFWKEYPKKVGKGKAYKAWQKVKVNDTIARNIVISVRKYINTKEWKKENGQFIPHPATFLNERRFDDDVQEQITNNNTIERF